MRVRVAVARRAVTVLLVLSSLGIWSCLFDYSWESMDIRFTRDQDKPRWNLRQTLWNVGASDSAMLSEAYDSLIASWEKSSDDTTDLHLVGRRAWTENGRLCLEFVGWSDSLPDDFELSDDSMTIVYDDPMIGTLTDVLETNGTVVADGGEVKVHWPSNAQEFYIKTCFEESVVPFSEKQQAEFIRATEKLSRK